MVFKGQYSLRVKSYVADLLQKFIEMMLADIDAHAAETTRSDV